MRIKKLIAVFLIFSVLIFPVSAVSVAKNKTVNLTVDSVSAQAGDTVSIGIHLANNPGIVSANINVAFDEGLTLIGAANGNTFPKSMLFIPPKQLSTTGKVTEKCNFAWQGVDIEDKDIKDGIILTLRFKVSEKAASGDVYGITVTARSSDIVDKNLQCIKLDASQGKISIGTNQQNRNNDNMFGDFIKKIIDLISKLFIRIKRLFLIQEL